MKRSLALALALAACRREAPHPDVEAIEPSSILEGTETVALVRGRNFRNVVRANVEGGEPVIDRTWRVAIGDVDLPIANVEWIDAASLQVILPATLAVGTYDVRVESPAGFSDTLDGGLQVLPQAVMSTALRIVAISAPAQLAKRANDVPIGVTVANGSSGEAWLTAVSLEFESLNGDATNDYRVFARERNPARIAAQSSANLMVWLEVKQGAAVETGTIDVTARIEGWVVADAGFSRDDEATTWNVADVLAPRASVDTAPPSFRACVGQLVSFAGSADQGTAPYSFSWLLPGATATTTTGAYVDVTYGDIGNEPYLLSVVDAAGFVSNEHEPSPVFIGDLEAGAASYPAGEVVLSSPAGTIDLRTLPAPIVASDALAGLRQCDGSLLPAESANAYVTLVVERGALDPAEDDRPAIPGIQRNLGAQGEIPPTTLRPDPIAIEGSAMVHAEFRKEPDGLVTAAGFRFFTLGTDLQSPALVASLPAADCANACWGKDDPWRFRFDEPMLGSSFDPRVEWAPGSEDCATGSFTDVTAASTFVYRNAERVLEVVPAVQADTEYTVRVLVSTTARDASDAGNPLPPVTRCAVVSDSPVSTPGLPALVSAPLAISPDDDGAGDTASFIVSVDSATRVVRLRIERNFMTIATVVREVDAPGEHVIVWDGRDSGGRRVIDGFYHWRVFSESAGGLESPPIEGVIEVDGAGSFIGHEEELN